MFKKLILIICLSFLFFNRIDSDLEVPFSGKDISLKDSEFFSIDYEKNIVSVGKEKIILETFLDTLDCNNKIFIETDFFKETLSSYGVSYFMNKCGGSVEPNFLFVGDMMFDRGVELLMKKNDDFNYPFSKIETYLKKVDNLIGNLEGPIVSEPVFISATSMSFSFDKRVASALKENNFNILSLANNHTSNMNASGLIETKEYLNEKEISYFGDPVTCDAIDIAVVSGVVFYGVNKTFDFNCNNEEIIKNIKKIKEEYSDKFLVVLPHFGNEYEHKASLFQEELAHLMIDNGADLIIGGHPHVIQNVEKYKNKLIFYSLGNFIFDQYFSEETQQGIMVGLEFVEGKEVYSIFPIKEEKAQPSLGDKSILNFLASISSSELKEEIEKGEIIIY